MRKRLAELTDSESARRQMKNLFYIHANLAEEKDPRIVLKFPLNYVEVRIYDIQIQFKMYLIPLHLQVLRITSPLDTEEVFITDITHRGELAKPTEAASNQPSTLDLLSVVVPFTIADATADLSVHDQYMSENVEAFGRKGKQAVADFKVGYYIFTY